MQKHRFGGGLGGWVGWVSGAGSKWLLPWQRECSSGEQEGLLLLLLLLLQVFTADRAKLEDYPVWWYLDSNSEASPALLW
jgi:hypothetical protein